MTAKRIEFMGRRMYLLYQVAVNSQFPTPNSQSTLNLIMVLLLSVTVPVMVAKLVWAGNGRGMEREKDQRQRCEAGPEEMHGSLQHSSSAERTNRAGPRVHSPCRGQTVGLRLDRDLSETLCTSRTPCTLCGNFLSPTIWPLHRNSI